ncbi:phosphatidylinositol-3,5-bisphosphate 3-phosphatase MTMR6-like isoform X2 [Salvelinus alpinus]|uniref:phosphatidylinositol-3,5-bisphosphate 3-phosphatase MTMR6-like isoform X2 n=1 Tax=Salvelinus alpinus TaxID=8036 RepID=UPI0039FB9BA2
MEHIRTPKVELVRLLERFSNKSTSGTLHLTATHLIFVESNNAATTAAQEIWILHHHIASVEKLSLTTSGCPLVIQCRNFRVVHFVVQRERDCHDIYSSLLRLLRPVSYDELYAFSYNPKQNEQQREEGWQLIDLGAEFERMGVPCDRWQLTDVNRDYKICETYPRDLYVPITASKPIIVGSSKFRSKGRFPVLTYFYQEKKAAVCRCSQPLSGFSARCLEDESMLQAISKANHNSRFVYVMDTRPKLNAMANRAAGKGYENEDNYSNIRFQFVGIENIHVMRTSLQKLLEVVGSRFLSVNDYLLGLESCGWLRHVKAVVDAAIFLTKTISRDLLPYLTSLINSSLTAGYVPSVFKRARVAPLLKKPTLDPSDVNNYRPVSLLSFLSKTLERAVLGQLSCYLSQNDLLDPNQSGFKTSHSTETALLCVTEALRTAKANSLSSALILLDLSAAFDTVNQPDPPLHPLRAGHLRRGPRLDCVLPDRSLLPGGVARICLRTTCSHHWCPPGLCSRPSPILAIHQVTWLCHILTWSLLSLLCRRHTINLLLSPL